MSFQVEHVSKQNEGFPERSFLPNLGKRWKALRSTMNVRLEKIMAALLALLAISGFDGRAQGDPGGVAAGIQAIQEDEETIRVVVAGQFETTFTRKKGFGGVWFDLQHDPQRKRDLAPVLDENGFLWIKNGPPGADGSWYANPPREMTLLESGPIRVRVRLNGSHQRYGMTKPGAAWKELGFEQTFTVYPSGAIYVDYALIAQAPIEFHHFLLILKPNGAWGNRGKGEGAGEVRCAGEFGPNKPSGATASPFALEWTDGPTYFQDILLVMHTGKYNGSYWNEGYEDKDLRAGLDLLRRWPDRTLPKGRDPIHLMMVFRHDLNGHEAAQPYANDYRSPDHLAVSKGRLDTIDDGDTDADGFNETEGCYVLKSAREGVAFTLHGRAIPRMFPAFKIKDWRGAAPEALALGGKKLTAGKDFNASVREGVLLLQIFRIIKDHVSVSIPGP